MSFAKNASTERIVVLRGSKESVSMVSFWVSHSGDSVESGVATWGSMNQLAVLVVFSSNSVATE